MKSFFNDLKHSLRVVRQSPSLTITVVAAIALGIGANTAMFTVINTVLLDRLPYPESDRIVDIARPGGGAISEPLFTYWE
jgi:putative ABC transport system permease protein